MDSLNTRLEILIGNQRIGVIKEVLIEKSDYFNALFRSQMKESICSQIIINELEFNSLKLVLNIAHSIQNSDQLLNSLDLNEDLFKVIVIANKYLFIEIEKLSSEKLKRSFGQITDSMNFSQIWSIYEKSLHLNLTFLTQLCLKHFDENANIVIEYLTPNLFHNISFNLLINILSRDTFGIKEIQILRFVEKWNSHLVSDSFRKNCFNKSYDSINSLIKTIRFSLISQIELNYGLTSSPLFKIESLKNALKEINCGNCVEKSRICFQPNVTFAINDCDIDEIKVSMTLFAIQRTTAKRICFNLAIETKINYIKFKLNFNRINYCYPLVYYYCEVCVNSQWTQVIDCTQYPCFATQELYFDPLIVSSIRIIGAVSAIYDAFDFCVHFCYDNLLLYGFTEKPLKTNNKCILPMKDYLLKSDAICLIRFLKISKTYEMTEYVLKNKLYMNSNINFNNFEKFGYETTYLIRLTQPVFANCLKIEFQIDGKQSVNYLVCICESFEAIGLNNLITIMDQKECKTVTNLIVFDAKQILSVRISGFRCFDKTVKLPLHIRNVKLFYDNQLRPVTPLNIHI